MIHSVRPLSVPPSSLKNSPPRLTRPVGFQIHAPQFGATSKAIQNQGQQTVWQRITHFLMAPIRAIQWVINAIVQLFKPEPLWASHNYARNEKEGFYLMTHAPKSGYHTTLLGDLKNKLENEHYVDNPQCLSSNRLRAVLWSNSCGRNNPTLAIGFDKQNRACVVITDLGSTRKTNDPRRYSTELYLVSPTHYLTSQQKNLVQAYLGTEPNTLIETTPFEGTIENDDKTEVADTVINNRHYKIHRGYYKVDTALFYNALDEWSQTSASKIEKLNPSTQAVNAFSKSKSVLLENTNLHRAALFQAIEQNGIDGKPGEVAVLVTQNVAPKLCRKNHVHWCLTTTS